MLAPTQDDEQIIERIAALDIGKAELSCCVRVPDPKEHGAMAGSVTCVLDPYAADRSALGELARLSDPQRNVLGRAFFHELTYEQIAACTGLRLGTVKSQILGGLLRLRTRLRVNREL